MYLVVIQGESCDCSKAPECPVFDDRDVVLPEVYVVKITKLSHGLGGHVLQPVVGEDQVLERPCQGGQAVWHQAGEL